MMTSMDSRVAIRRRLNGHGSFVILLTGLSGAGKTTLGSALEEHLLSCGMRAILLDGDRIRLGLSAGLGFSAEDRGENLRRSAEAARLLVDSGSIVIAAFIAPFREDRQRFRERFAPDEFAEVHLNCSFEACRLRDAKGLYQRAGAGSIGEFTGFSSPYEAPLSPELVLATEAEPPPDCLRRLQDLVWEMDQRQE